LTRRRREVAMPVLVLRVVLPAIAVHLDEVADAHTRGRCVLDAGPDAAEQRNGLDADRDRLIDVELAGLDPAEAGAAEQPDERDQPAQLAGAREVERAGVGALPQRAAGR